MVHGTIKLVVFEDMVERQSFEFDWFKSVTIDGGVGIDRRRAGFDGIPPEDLSIAFFANQSTGSSIKGRNNRNSLLGDFPKRLL